MAKKQDGQEVVFSFDACGYCGGRDALSKSARHFHCNRCGLKTCAPEPEPKKTEKE